MTDRPLTNPADYVVPLDINKLEGRMLYLPASSSKSRDILLVYGQHGMLERWWSLAENLNDYGSVTVPDMPGFGGMDSFYKIHKKPDIDAYADYLAAFIKLRFRRKRITIVGVSFGFVVITRMLQRYPELTRKIDLLISIGGYMHSDDFVYPKWKLKSKIYASKLLSVKSICLLERIFIINRPAIGLLYSSESKESDSRHKISKQELAATLDFETNLWVVNDLRSHWYTTNKALKLDNCQIPVDLPVVHVVPRVDENLDHDLIKQHMLVVFRSYKGYISNNKNHPVSVISDKKGTAILLPPGVRRMLNT